MSLKEKTLYQETKLNELSLKLRDQKNYLEKVS